MRQSGCGGHIAAWAAAAALCVAVGCGEEPVEPGAEVQVAADGQASGDDGGSADAGSGQQTDAVDGPDGGGASADAPGDRCEQAFVVDLSQADEVSLAGDQGDYTSRWSAEGRQGCSLYDGEPAGKTDGPEVFLRLTGHGVDEGIEFDAEGGGTTFAFYLLEGCEASSCVDSGVFDEQVDNRVVWRASTGADIWVAAEVFGPPRERPFEVVVRRVE